MSAKKLTLNKETLLSLTESDFSQVAGGTATQAGQTGCTLTFVVYGCDGGGGGTSMCDVTKDRACRYTTTKSFGTLCQ